MIGKNDRMGDLMGIDCVRTIQNLNFIGLGESESESESESRKAKKEKVGCSLSP